jgi:DNA-binding beta-propeller fold protein YncE
VGRLLGHGPLTIHRVFLLRRVLSISLTLAVAVGGAGCGTARHGSAPAGPSAGARSAPGTGGVSVGSGRGAPPGEPAVTPGEPVITPVRTDVPEPARAPSLTRTPAGTVLPMPGAPEGLAVDDRDGLLAVGLRRPDGIALVSAVTGRVRKVVRLPGAPRHLQLAGPAGPVLVPAEQVGRLFQVALPSGAVVADTRVGRQPHDAAAAGPVVFVGNEYSNTISLVRGGRQVAVEPAPRQPGGVAAARNGSAVVVVGVRGRQIEAYAPDGRPLGTAPVGVGPTHVRAAPNGLFYVADTEGDAVVVFRVTAQGPRRLGSVHTRCCTPYGIAIDGRRSVIYVTLTATNQVESFRIAATGLVPDRTWPAVRQPNDVAVNEATGRVFVVGAHDGQLQLIDPFERV